MVTTKDITCRKSYSEPTHLRSVYLNFELRHGRSKSTVNMTKNFVEPPLSQGWGYGIVLGLGIAFAVIMAMVTWLLKKYNGENNRDFETFVTAGRTVGVGLTATAVISSWAWSTALLASGTITYMYGVGGAFWYGAGCIVQICLFALLAIQSKLKTPRAQTILEVVKFRYGSVAHVLYMCLCFINNLIAVVNMLLGASACISSLTGMHIVASIFLLPIGVCLYTISGGLRATFITDWAHTVSLFIIVLFLSLKTITSPEINSLANLWQKLGQAKIAYPVPGNYDGSYMTMTSPSAVEFGVLHTLANFGLVIMDSSYWQKAYSADVAAAVPGYLLGGALYMGLPWCLGTVSGLSAIALQNSDSWPAFGRRLTDHELNAGLVLPYLGMAVAGKGGAVAVTVVIFMAVTSTMSAELIAVSSIVSKDIYQAYLNNNASSQQVIRVSHLACLGFAITACAASIAVFYAGVSLTWTVYFLGIITCPGMITLPLTVLWNGQTRIAAITSPLVGLIGGLMTWIATAWHYGDHIISIQTTGLLLPCLWGTLVSASLPVVITLLVSILFPSKPFSWTKFNNSHLTDDEISTNSVVAIPTESKDKYLENKSTSHEGFSDIMEAASTDFEEPAKLVQIQFMKRQSIVSGLLGATFFLLVWVIWPFSMYGARFEFSERFLSQWVIVSIVWVFLGFFVVLLLPPFDGRQQLKVIITGIWADKISTSF